MTSSPLEDLLRRECISPNKYSNGSWRENHPINILKGFQRCHQLHLQNEKTTTTTAHAENKASLRNGLKEAADIWKRVLVEIAEAPG
jgi:hypothetical protein